MYVYFLCGLVCICIHESDAELICMCFFLRRFNVLCYASGASVRACVCERASERACVRACVRVRACVCARVCVCCYCSLTLFSAIEHV